MNEALHLEAGGPDPDALVKAIAAASAAGRPLLLESGTHLTSPGRVNQIPIGRNGLVIGPAQPSPAKPPVIKRPDRSIDVSRPDDNHGLFFVPSPPDRAELSGATWRHYEHEQEEFEFDIVMRGSIRISGVRVDCNMGNQGLEPLPTGAAEHSCMLGFTGKRYAAGVNPATGLKRFIFVGFVSVELSDLSFTRGGYSDEVWFSRGYFNPNIARVRVDRLVQVDRLNTKRATVDFSGLCQDIRVTNSRFFRLGCEATDVPFRDMPRTTRDFKQSVWTLSDLELESVDLGAHGRSYLVRGTRLEVSDQFILHEASGSIDDSALSVLDRQRLIALDRFVFRNVDWTLGTKDGRTLGLKISADNGQPSTVSFLDNTFTVVGTAAEQVVLDSEYSNGVPANHVRVVATGCRYPASYGGPGEPPIAHVFERGRWTFAQADLEGRDPAVALPTKDHDDVILELI